MYRGSSLSHEEITMKLEMISFFIPDRGNMDFRIVDSYLEGEARKMLYLNFYNRGLYPGWDIEAFLDGLQRLYELNKIKSLMKK